MKNLLTALLTLASVCAFAAATYAASPPPGAKTIAVSLTGNLDSRFPAQGIPQTRLVSVSQLIQKAGMCFAIDLADPLGKARTTELCFLKSAANRWRAHAFDTAKIRAGFVLDQRNINTRPLVFTASGNLQHPTHAKLRFPLAAGGMRSRVVITLSDLTQVTETSRVDHISVNIR